MSWHAIDLIEPAIDKTKKFFSGPGLFWKWVKIGLLVFVFSLFSGGGGGSNFNFNSNSLDITKIKDGLTGLPAWFASIPQQTINAFAFWILIGIVILFVFSIIFTLLKNMCFFAILESVSTNQVSIISYLKKFYRKALSLSILEITLALLGLPFMLIMLLAGISLALFFLKIDPAILGPAAGLASNTVLMGLLVLISIIAFIVLAIINYLVIQFVAYWLYLSELRAWEALKKSISLTKQNILQVVLLIIMQTILSFVATIIQIIGVLVIAIPFVIVGLLLALVLIPLVSMSAAVLIPAILLLIIGFLVLILVATIIFVPIDVFFFNYNLMFLQKLISAKQTKKN